MSVRARKPDDVERVRLARGLTIATVARNVGTSRPFMSLFLRGHRPASIPVAQKVFKELGLTDREANRLFKVTMRIAVNSVPSGAATSQTSVGVA